MKLRFLEGFDRFNSKDSLVVEEDRIFFRGHEVVDLEKGMNLYLDLVDAIDYVDKIRNEVGKILIGQFEQGDFEKIENDFGEFVRIQKKVRKIYPEWVIRREDKLKAIVDFSRKLAIRKGEVKEVVSEPFLRTRRI